MIKIYLKSKKILTLDDIRVVYNSTFIEILTKKELYDINVAEIEYMTKNIIKKSTKETIDNVIKSDMKRRPTCFGNETPRMTNASISEPHTDSTYPRWLRWLDRFS